MNPVPKIDQLALSILWCADQRGPEVFKTPRFHIEGVLSPCDADVAAAWLALQSKPLWLRGEAKEDGILSVSLSPPPMVRATVNGVAMAWRAESLVEMINHLKAHRVLILAGDLVWRVSRKTLVRVAQNYWFSPRPAMVMGGPLHDAWVQGLKLPPEWLNDCDAVFTVCQSSRIGEGWRQHASLRED